MSGTIDPVGESDVREWYGDVARWWWVGGLAILALFIFFILRNEHGSTSPSAPPSIPIPYAPLQGATIPVKMVLGSASLFSAPHDAAMLPNGTIAVTDVTHSRVALLNSSGHLLRFIYRGSVPWHSPYGVVADGDGFDVLEAESGTIDRITSSGAFVSRIARAPTLQTGRSLYLGFDGRFYVANPAGNSVVILDRSGHVEQGVVSPLGAGLGQFNQVSDAVVGPDGRIFVVDDQNSRIEELSRSGAFIAEWPAPAADTLHSIHLLPLGRGRVLADEPGGALLVYPAGGGQPTRLPLSLHGQPLSSSTTGLIGLMPGTHGRVVLTDGVGGRVLIVPFSL